MSITNALYNQISLMLKKADLNLEVLDRNDKKTDNKISVSCFNTFASQYGLQQIQGANDDVTIDIDEVKAKLVEKLKEKYPNLKEEIEAIVAGKEPNPKTEIDEKETSIQESETVGEFKNKVLEHLNGLKNLTSECQELKDKILERLEYLEARQVRLEEIKEKIINDLNNLGKLANEDIKDTEHQFGL